MREKEEFWDFNFWPSFVDTLLYIFVGLLFSISIGYAVTLLWHFDTSQVERRKQEFLEGIAKAFDSSLLLLKKGDVCEENICKIYEIKIYVGGAPDTITVKDYVENQILRFSSSILFPQDEYKLSPRGEEVLKRVGREIIRHINYIKEIQIRGHADIDRTYKYRSNLELGALRAMEVFEYLRKNVGINPALYNFSAATFGEYMPFYRDPDEKFSEERLIAFNSDDVQKSLNRRVEIFLIWKLK